MDPAALELLLTPRGQRLLAAGESSYDGTDPMALTERLRRLDGGLPADLVAAALTQVRLRRSATAKFGADAARMYFTQAGLEQATHPAVARHRAARACAAAPESCLDLGCGIGSDLMAFARAGLTVTGVDSDDTTARVAAANLAALGLEGEVRSARAETVDLESVDVVFADPSRRRGSTRVFDPRAFSPAWDFILTLLVPPGSVGNPPRAVVKLAPGLDHDLVPPHVEAEWVSLDGRLKEAVLWSPAADGARRRATLLGSDGSTVSRSDETSPTDAPAVGEVGRYLYEPDDAVIRAHLVSAVVEDLSGWLLDPHIAYISTDSPTTTPFARAFGVLEVLPFKEKALRAALRARGIGSLTIKKRGVAVTPEDLRRRLALRGDQQATLVLTRTPRSATALLVEPLE